MPLTCYITVAFLYNTYSELCPVIIPVIVPIKIKDKVVLCKSKRCMWNGASAVDGEASGQLYIPAAFCASFTH